MSPRLPRAVFEPVARFGLRPVIAAPVRVKRPVLGALSYLNVVPRGLAATRETRGGIAGEMMAPGEHVGPARILYLHGGAYEAGSPRTHRALTGALAARTGEGVFAPDYRLAPEHPAPAALEDALDVYEAMTSQADGALVMAGDSAGGGLTLATAVAARERGLAPPRALALISPWVDLTLSGPSHRLNDGADALLTAGSLVRAARNYAAGLGPEDPICSPLRAELTGLPPILIHAGSNELLRSDAEELARRLRAAGVDAELRVFDGLWHDFHVHAGMLREADEALAELGEFLGAALSRPRALA